MKRGRRLPRLIAPGGQFSELILAIVLAAGLAFGAIAGQAITIARLAIGLLGGLLFFLISMSGRLTSLRLIMTWLVFLGLLRRALIPIAGWSEQDPLLLVAPGAAVLIWMSGRKTVPTKRDALSFFGLLFIVWSVGQLFNPVEPDLSVSLKGLIFWLPPVIWLFVGRTFPASVHAKIGNLLMVLAIPVAAHGLYQNFRGLLPFEYTWVGVSGFGASIFFEGFRIRPFSSLSSPQEYGAFLSVALSFLWGSILARKSRLLLRILVFGFLSVALFLQGSRSIFGLFLLMVFATTVIWSKNYALKLALVATAIAMVGALQMDLIPTELGDGPVATAAEHQIKGFQSPEESTAPLHRQMIVDGFGLAWDKPLGHGLGRTTIAAAKEGRYGGGTEYDMSNVFVSFGVPMGMFYLIFIILVYGTALRRVLTFRTAYSIGALGAVMVVFGNLWNGGLYTVSAIVWLTIGAMTRPVEELEEVEEEEQEEVAVPSPVMVPAHGTS